MSTHVPGSTPQGAVVALGVPDSWDYPRLVYVAPYFQQVPLAELIEPSVQEAVEGILPALVPPYVDGAANAAVQNLAVLLTGSTMTGPLFLNPTMPTQPSQAASMAYVDAMVATAGVPEVPPVPTGQIWARETGQWVPIDPSGGSFLALAGGTMQGQINMGGNAIVNMPALPVLPNGAAPAQWVLNQIAAQSLYQGTWDMDTYTPDLTAPATHQNGFTWIAITTSTTGVVIGPAIPGLQGLTVFNGDTVIYSAIQGVFNRIHAGGLTIDEANALFLALAGGQMSGALLLNANATQPTQATTLQQVQALVAGAGIGEAPTTGLVYGRSGLTASWLPALPLAGGALTGALTLFANATQPLQPVTLQQQTSSISAAVASYLPLAGGTMTGLIQLSGNATNALNPVSLQQISGMLGGYLPLSGGTLSGNLNVTGNIGGSGSVTGLTGQFGGITMSAGALGGLTSISAPGATANIGGVSFTGSGALNANVTAVTSLSSTGAVNGASGNIAGVTFTGTGAVNAQSVAAGTLNGNTGTIGGNSFPGNALITPSQDGAGEVGVPGFAYNSMASYGFNQQSDPRTKKDIVAAPAGSLAQVLAIPVHNYRFLIDAETAPLHWGFLSTDVHAAMGDNFAGWSQGTDANKTESLGMNDMIAVLWAAVQELAQKVSVT